MVENLIISASVVGGLGLLFGLGLSIASKAFEVKVDEKVTKVRKYFRELTAVPAGSQDAMPMQSASWRESVT